MFSYNVHAFQNVRLGSTRHILQKKLGLSQLALSFKKLSYLEKQKIELISNIFANFLRYNPEDIYKNPLFATKKLNSLKKSTENNQK